MSLDKEVHAELARVVELLNAATPGEWRWSANGNIMAPGNRDVDEICAVYTERDDDLAPRNAEAIIAAVNFLRKHGASLLSSRGGGGEAVAGTVAGYLSRQRAVEVVLDGPVPEWITANPSVRAYLVGRPALDAVGREGEGHNADWCAGWNAHILATVKRTDPSLSLHDRVEFALRDSGFDYDEAFRIAELADAPPPQPRAEGMVLVDGKLYSEETVKTALLGLAADYVAAAPGEGSGQ
jgi:hypothetical protein